MIRIRSWQTGWRPLSSSVSPELDDALEDLRDARTRRVLGTTVENLDDAAETAGRHDRARAVRRYVIDDPIASSP